MEKFTVKTNEHGELWITHNEHPRFVARWVGGLNGLDNMEWQDEYSMEVMAMARLMREAGEAIYEFKKENK